MPTDGARTDFGPGPGRAPEAVPRASATTWREYFYRSFLKVWVLCFFFVADVWIVAQWIYPWRSANLAYMALSLAVASYLEFLAYQVLWYEPSETSRSTRDHFQRGWMHPVPWGRWSEARTEHVAVGSPEHPVDPHEFL